jgi:hypothetical protein
MFGGGVGVLDSGKLATSRLTERDLIEPNVWSGDKLAPTEGTIPLLQQSKQLHDTLTTSGAVAYVHIHETNMVSHPTGQ